LVTLKSKTWQTAPLAVVQRHGEVAPWWAGSHAAPSSSKQAHVSSLLVVR